MTPFQTLFAAEVMRQEQTAEMIRAAMAARVGAADEDGWKAFMKDAGVS